MNNLRRLTAIITASALVLVGCSNEEQPAPETTVAETEATTTETTTEETAPGIEVEGAPEGFALTKPGTKLSFGEPAHVVVQSGESLAFLEVIAHAPREISVEEAQANTENALAADENTESFVCFEPTVRLLGVHGEAVAFEGNRWTPVDRRGRVANRVETGDNVICGTHDADLLPGNSAEMAEDREYLDTRAGFTTTDNSGINPTHIAFNYEVEGIDGIVEGDAVFWG